MNLITSVKKVVLRELTIRQSKMALKSKIASVEKIILLRGNDKKINEIFCDVDDEFWFWILAEGNNFIAALNNILPGMPSKDIQKRFTGSVGYGEAFQVYKLKYSQSLW